MTHSKPTEPSPPEKAVEIDDATLDSVAGGRKAGEGQKDWPDPPPPPPPPPPKQAF